MSKRIESELKLIFWLKSFHLSLMFFLTIVLYIEGCASSHKEAFDSVPSTNVKKVAVLPFYNISGYRDAGKIIANVFVTEMFKSGRFRVEESGNIVQFMIQERIDTIGEIEVERLTILGKRMGVDAVMTGTVEEFAEGGSAYSTPIVSITARMIDSNTGKLIWSGQNKRKGEDYIIVLDLGEVKSVTTLAQKVVKEMIDTIK